MNHRPPLEEVVLKPNSSKCLILIGKGLCFLLLAIYFWSINSYLFMSFFLFFVSFFIIYMGLRAYSQGLPLLILFQKGFSYQGGFLKMKIAWSAVERVEQNKNSKRPSVLIYLKDPQMFIQQQSGLKKLLYQMNFKVAGTPITFSTGVFDLKFDELFALFKKYLAVAVGDTI